MCQLTGCGRRAVERMRDTIRDVFPQMEEIPDHPTKRFHIPKALDGFFQAPTPEELSDLGVVVAEFLDAGATARAESLGGLERKIRAAMRHGRRRTTETDVEALLQAERIAVQAGPRPTEDPAVLIVLRKALLGMKMLRFTYHGGTQPGASRDVVPYGIIFGRMNYLIGADAGTTKPAPIAALFRAAD
jgi:predicted DNA-binding transcriptional regulator YafY